ncbi:MAG: methyltransferase domain-containing protein [Mycobacteriales bacterium]
MSRTGGTTSTSTGTDLREAVRDPHCPGCHALGRPTRLVVREGSDPYRLHRCPSCRTQFLRADGVAPQWGDDSRYWETKDYKVGIYGSPDVQEDYRRRYRSVLATVQEAAGPIRSVLDVGCGTGNFLALAESLGMTATGVDIDPRPVAEARTHGLTAWTPEELDAHVPDRSVDAVTLWDVLEHVLVPGPFLDDLLRKLRPGGLVVLEVPDGTFPLRTVARGLHQVTGGRVRLARRLYYWEHKTYYSPEGLRALLAEHGARTLLVRRLTSPRAKMAHLLDRSAQSGRFEARFWSRAWPLLETATRRAGAGNKLLLVAQLPGDGGRS